MPSTVFLYFQKIKEQAVSFKLFVWLHSKLSYHLYNSPLFDRDGFMSMLHNLQGQSQKSKQKLPCEFMKSIEFVWFDY